MNYTAWKKSSVYGMIPTTNKWKTIHFSTDQMRTTLGFGTPIFDGIVFKGFSNEGQLNTDIWLSFVPNVYRRQCKKICKEIPDRYKLSRDIIFPIRYLQQRIMKEVKPL